MKELLCIMIEQSGVYICWLLIIIIIISRWLFIDWIRCVWLWLCFH